MPKEKIDKEDFVKRVYENVNEMKIPLIDERVYNKAVIGKTAVTVTFKYEGDDSVIKGFLGLADYYHTVVIRKEYAFFIPWSNTIFELIC
ncbi:MAG: hypothetical protein EAX96_05170 [Candidatus Lokiarchaeota archaeon]|nr:hypothetical protein [Candidatus Lokiarchaeota archaeon]